MSRLTRKAIMRSCAAMLEERPLSRITVKAIAEDCGITRNTFYYHFADLPALAEAMIEEQTQEIWKANDTPEDLAQCLQAALEETYAHRKAILNVWNSTYRVQFETSLMGECRRQGKKLAAAQLQGQNVSEEMRAMAEYCSACQLYGMISDWLNSGLSEDRHLFFQKMNCWVREHPEASRSLII